MDVMTIMGLVAKGLSLLPTIIQAGGDAIQTIKVLEDLSSSTADGTVTQTQVDDVEAHLDALMEQFNAPDPGEPGAAA